MKAERGSLTDPGSDGPRVAPKHIIDVLLEERAPRLTSGPLWPVVRWLLFALLDYRGARATADAIAGLDGACALAFARRLLHLNVVTRGLDRVPREGRCLIVANHPTGIADGLAVSEALAAVRPDQCYFANADALRVCPGLSEIVIPVEWIIEKRTIEKAKLIVRLARHAFEKEMAVVIFPAGAPARRIDGRVQEPPWERSAVSLARKHDASIIPVHVSGPFPFFYHAFDMISRELRNLTLFRELLNKAGKRYDLAFGPPISPRALAGDSELVTQRLRRYVERSLAENPDQVFEPTSCDADGVMRT